MATDRAESHRGGVRRDWRRSPGRRDDDEQDRYSSSGRRNNGNDRYRRDDRGDRYHSGRERETGKAREPSSITNQARRDDTRWRSAEKDRKSSTVSLASRIAPAATDASRTEGAGSNKAAKSGADVTTEDEEARQRRIQRLKRRRRSAGLDSDVSEDELVRWYANLENGSENDRRKDGKARSGEVSGWKSRDSYQSRKGSVEEVEERRAYRGEERSDTRRTLGDDRGASRRDGVRAVSPYRTSRNDDRAKDVTGRDHRVRDRPREYDDRHHADRSGRYEGEEDRSRGGPSSNSSRYRSERSPEAVTLRRRRSRSRTPTRADRNGVSAIMDRDASSKMAEARREVKPALAQRAGADEVYERLAQVGEGTYGQVFKAKSDRTGVLVALKKIRMDAERDGFPITAMREVKLLQGLRHENIVRLHEMMLSKHSIYMVFEYLQHDLNGILAHPNVQFSAAHLKSLAAQLLSGLAYIHKHSILHRDLKCSNLLLNNEGTLKLADFGLARSYTKQARAPRRRTLDYTNRVVTLWYRAPELLFGETSYGDAIDVWGAGCIFLELFLRKPVFQGNDEIHQVQLLFSLLGPVRADEWPEATGLPWFELVQPSASEGEASQASTATDPVKMHEDHLRKLFDADVADDVVEAANALLTYNPGKRLSAQTALDSLAYFARNDPAPEKPASLLQSLQGEWHEFESRRARREAAAQALHAHVNRENANEKERKRNGESAVATKQAAVSDAKMDIDAFVDEAVTGSVTGQAAESIVERDGEGHASA